MVHIICYAYKTYTRKDFDIVIGMEFHLQTNTQTKLFSRASMGFSGDHTQPNTHVSLVDSAMPGALPSVNQECKKRHHYSFGIEYENCTILHV